MIRADLLFRVRIFTIGVCCISVLLIVRLYTVQVVQGTAYATRAEQQYVGSVRNLFERGTIYFSTKGGERVSAATLRTGYTLAINPTLIDDSGAVYDAISAIIPLDRDSFFARAEKKGDPYEEVAQRVKEADANQIRALKLRGVQLFRDQWRYYPGSALAAHAVGFVAYKDTHLGGRYGLERRYEDVLSRNSVNLFVNFFAELFEDFGSVVFDVAGEKEGDIVTTLEPAVERALEEALQQTHETYESRQTGGIIMDPHTGAIYAMAAYPTFDLNDFSAVPDPSVFNNPLVESAYEMGSIIKPLTIAAGLDSGVITPRSTYFDGGSVELDNITIKNFDERGRGTVSMQEVLNESLNTGVAHVMKLMGRDRFRVYFKDKFQLGERTGIDLPGEIRGLAHSLDSIRDVDYASASFGQAIALTPIATVRALSALGNGGLLVTPHLVERIIANDGEEHMPKSVEPTRILSPETSESITRMLVEVVDTALAGGQEKLEHYTIAAKTGTAQIALPNGKGYYDDRYLHSFFGYFPAYDPKFLVFLYTIEPQNVKYASQTLTQPFMSLAKFLLNYYDVPPDR